MKATSLHSTEALASQDLVLAHKRNSRSVSASNFTDGIAIITDVSILTSPERMRMLPADVARVTTMAAQEFDGIAMGSGSDVSK